MNVLVLSNLWAPFPGGAERMVFNLARELSHAADVSVLTGYERAQQFDGPPIVVRSIPDDDAGWGAVLRAVDAQKPDVILTHHWWAQNWRQQFDALAMSVPLVQFVYNGQRLENAALAVYISKFVRERCGDALPSDMTILPPVFSDVVAEQHGSAVGFVKPLPHKGAPLVYDIARRMPERHFVILRGEWQGLEVIEHLPNVEFMEPVDRMADFYARCAMVLMPSVSEDAGTVAQECTLNGIPCISTDVEGLAETNAGGVKLQSWASVDAWIEMIRSVLLHERTYDRVVEWQAEAWEQYDQDAKIAAFVERVTELGS